MLNKKVFLQKLHFLLNERHWTLNEFSERAGLSTGMIYRWVNTDRQPSFKSLQKLSDALGVSFEYFLTETVAEEKREKLNLLSIKAQKLTINQLSGVLRLIDALLKDNEERV